jgi:ABC-type multidrug transport system ATPase subunit
MSPKQQTEKNNLILKHLGLYDSQDTFVKNLSGGQQKRLSIAIELVDDPEVLFLDEPTTGLDSRSATQCILLLKSLALEGKTIICTIHAPSALLFEKFDHLYVLTEGSCIYQGASSSVVPFLANLDLICPASYNPADFLLEIANNDYGAHNKRLTDKIQNGLCVEFRAEPKVNFELWQSESENSKYSSPFIYQLLLLIWRNLIFMRRDKSFMLLRLAVSFTMAVFVGALFFNIGNLASHVFDNFKYVYVSTHFMTYAAYYSLMVRCKFNINQS